MNNTSKPFDVIIIGAGAAGLFAAIACGERKLRTLLIEKNRKIGVKILMSGGTRCNVTQNTDSRGIVQAFGRNGRFLHSALSKLSPQQVVDWFASAGVPTKTEPTGKIFPVSDRAIDVRDALLDRVNNQTSVEILTETPVQNIQVDDSDLNQFRVTTDAGVFAAKKVILTSGGKSYPGCGTTGDGYAWAKTFGHSIVAPFPALTPVVVPDQWVKELSGVSFSSATLAAFEATQPVPESDKNFRKKSLAVVDGALLFTHFGLSGPAPMNISKVISIDPKRNIKLVVDWMPTISSEELLKHFRDPAHRSHKLKSLVSSGCFLQQEPIPTRLLGILAAQSDFPEATPLTEISDSKRRNLINKLKRCVINVEGTRGFKKAEVTAGGIHLKEVDSQTMESKIQPGLFFAGEILDLDGPIGGYNFQAAFSTGNLAGTNV